MDILVVPENGAHCMPLDCNFILWEISKGSGELPEFPLA